MTIIPAMVITVFAMCNGDKLEWPALRAASKSSLHPMCLGWKPAADHVMAICCKACKIVAMPLPNWHVAPKHFKDESMAR